MIDRQIMGDQYDRRHPSLAIVQSLVASPRMDNAPGSTFVDADNVGPTTYGAAGALNDLSGQFDWSAGIRPDFPAMPEGDLWMGDSGDVSWLSEMPFVTGMDMT
ncbi:uncharacterized protein Z518_10778 [Rhinocladiella mackenziei CBS 650.93]|uniref:Uncharacterized protein n=1 Tax=Rhinocladiella mackenziei CBS 650.93 TaxID=1442369 RepID=A0A0D2I9B2_9EURO|nr:uncharacterized protein Z518_10778 [Rhinocladiella mackenziei CBS 650.93]KIW99850.1 hypothetical protein Z518_10778 [Rhinocladiella mackenziei CBS 650.93]